MSWWLRHQEDNIISSPLGDQDLAQEVGGIQRQGVNLSLLSPCELQTW